MIEDARKRVCGVKNGVFPNLFLVNGFAAGTWKIEIKPRRAQLTTEPCQAPAKETQLELVGEAERPPNLAALPSAARESEFVT